MYLKYLQSDKIKELSKTIRSTPLGVQAYENLKNGNYTIYFSIDPADESIRYEAYSPNLPLLGIRVKPDKSFSSLYYYKTHYIEDCALAYYIHEIESSQSEEELKAHYGESVESLSKMAKLTPEQIAKLAKSKNDLSDLIESLKGMQAPIISTTPTLSFHIGVIARGQAEVYPIIYGKLQHELRSISALLSSLEQEKIIADGKGEYLKLSFDAFPQEDQKILYSLTSCYNRLMHAFGPEISTDDLVDLLFYCQGKEILYGTNKMKIDGEIQNAEVGINEFGTLACKQIGEKAQSYVHKEKAVVFNKEEGEISLYRFANMKSAKLFGFVKEHPNFPYSSLQEEIGANLVPLLFPNDGVEISQTFKEKSDKIRTYIAYTIDYEEGDDVHSPKLTCRTNFKRRGEEISLQEYLASSNPVYDKFQAELSKLGLIEEEYTDKVDRIASVLDTSLESLTPYCTLYLSDNITGKLVHHRSSPVTLRASSGMDWFDVSFDSNTLSPSEINELLNAYKKKKKYVRIGKDYYATDDENLRRAIENFAPTTELTSEHLPLYKALNLKLETGLYVEIDDKLKVMFNDLMNYSQKEVQLSPEFKSVLRPYQLDAVKWLSVLSRNGLGGILADDMGLGKTLEMIAFLSLLTSQSPTLIVCPKSLIYNWKSEFNKWDSERDVYVVEGGKSERKALIATMKEKKRKVFIVSYDSLRNDEDLYADISFHVVILDEAQYISNAAALKTKAVKSLKAKKRFVLTGTPIQNSYMDLWSIMDFLMPGYLEGYKEFQSLYASLADSKEAEVDSLEKRVAPFLLRRTKEEVLKDLPPKTEEVITIQMDSKEEKLYNAYFANAKLTLKEQRNDGRDRIGILAELTRLRQLCVDPSSFLNDYHDISAKLAQTLAMTQEAVATGHKVLIFSSFVTVLNHLQKIFEENGLSSMLIYGDVPAKERLKMADEFNSEDKNKIMLVSLKSGGTGLNLVGADIVIHLDPWWNIAAENQASDRAHRIGQTRPVTVWKLVAKNTIEEKIIELQLAKRKLTSIIRVADEEGSSLTEEDIRFLLS